MTAQHHSTASSCSSAYLTLLLMLAALCAPLAQSQPTDNRSSGSHISHRLDGVQAEAGIVIAFPQRDIHFDSKSPLRIEMAPTATNTPKPIE